MDQIGLFFKCQSCLDYELTSNIQCPNGHQVCQTCFENLSHCPTCHQRVAPSTRIPFLLTTGVDPILNVGDSYDLLLPSLLRVAPALHPCTADEMIFTGKQQSDLNLNDLMNTDTSMQRNNSIADQLLMANNCEVEETLSRLMMLASMSPGPAISQVPNSTTGGKSIQSGSLINSTTLLSTNSANANSNAPIINQAVTSNSCIDSSHQVDSYTDF